jgi:MSHA biogenesis protein MshM
MYLNHYGLAEMPFGITPDTSFAFSATAHQEALNTLLIAVKSGEGFIKITGEVGTGKTLLCRRFLAALDGDFVTAYLPNPYLELGVELPRDADQYHLLKSLNQTLMDIAAQRKSVVVCLDEAQAMPLETMEVLRLLSNLETEKRKLLQLVLFGQPELDTKLANPSVRQLRQRISFSYRLGGLKRHEMDLYLAHRLHVAGHRGERVFKPGASRLIHKVTSGTPRLVNILAHKALLSAYGEGRQQVTAGHVKTAIGDTEGVRMPRWAFW